MKQSQVIAVAFGFLTIVLNASALGQSDTDILRGPKVPEASRRTIVYGGMQAGFNRVEGRPEAAAVMLLDIKPERMRTIEAIIREHDMKVAMMLVDRIDDVRVISDAVLAGDRERARELLKELWRVHDPKRQRSPLLADLEPLLSDEEQAEVERLVNEYWQAWIRSAMPKIAGEMDEAQQKKIHDRIERQLAFQLFEEEVQRGYELTLRRYKQVLDGIYGAVEPTDTQREAIRSVVLKHIKETRLEPTQAQRREAYLAIYELLDEQRREKLFDYLLRQILKEG
jgi:hypothetical protein